MPVWITLSVVKRQIGFKNKKYYWERLGSIMGVRLTPSVIKRKKTISKQLVIIRNVLENWRQLVMISIRVETANGSPEAKWKKWILILKSTLSVVIIKLSFNLYFAMIKARVLQYYVIETSILYYLMGCRHAVMSMGSDNRLTICGSWASLAISVIRKHW